MLLLAMSWFRHVRQPLNLQQYAMFGKNLECCKCLVLVLSKAFTRGMDPRGHQLPKKVYGFRNLWISSKDFTDFS